MRRLFLSLWLLVLRSLIYVKRALVWILGQVINIFVRIARSFDDTIGFRLYKVYLSLRKNVSKERVPVRVGFLTFITARNTLQAGLLVVGVIIMIPHSTLQSKSVDEEVTGRDSLLYALVGPSNEISEADSVYLTLNAAVGTQGVPAWRQGAVSTISPSQVGVETTQETGPLTGVSRGGSALQKPVIAPGVEIESGASSAKPATGRNQVIQYTVQSGDVIGGIAEQFGISVNTILWANNLTSRSYIRPGDVLDIPPIDGVIHTVRNGQTVSQIARLYDAEQNEVISYNNLSAGGANIRVGQELVIPHGTLTPVAPSRPTVQPSQQIRDVAAPPPSVEAPAGSGYIWPTSVRVITQYFGWRHTGLDIAGPIGTPLYASRAGTVSKSQCGWNGGYGCYIIIDHGGGVQTLYGHASQLYVSAGDAVSQGQTIAAMGSTGNSTGPHIHFEVRVNGARVNPLQYTR